MNPYLVIGDDLPSLLLAVSLKESQPTILIRSSSQPGLSLGTQSVFPILPVFSLAAPTEFPVVPARVAVTIGTDSFLLPPERQRLLEFLCDVLRVPPGVVLALSRSGTSRIFPSQSVASLIPEPFLPFFETLTLPFSHSPFPFSPLSVVAHLISRYRPAFYQACSTVNELIQEIRSDGLLIEDEAVSAVASGFGRALEVRTAGGARIRAKQSFWGSSRLANLYAAQRSSRLLPCLLYATLNKEVPAPGVDIIRVDPGLPAWGDNFYVLAVLPFERGFSRFSSPRLIAYSIWSHRKWMLALRQGHSPAKSLADRVLARFPSATIHHIVTPAEFETHPLRYTALWGSFRFATVSFGSFWTDRWYSPPGVSLFRAGYPEADPGACISYALDIAAAHYRAGVSSTSRAV